MTIKEFMMISMELLWNGATTDEKIVELIRYQPNRPRIECNDGFSMSVQASDHHYCSPRISGQTMYSTYEIGFPSEKEELILEYAENPSRPRDTVYGYVPVEVIEKVIVKHDGLSDDKALSTLNEWTKYERVRPFIKSPDLNIDGYKQYLQLIRKD